MKRLITGLILVTVILMPVLLLLCSCYSSQNNTDLRGTAWHVVSINGTPVIAGSYLSLYLWSDGFLQGYAGINSYSSMWTEDGNQVNFVADNNSGGITMVGGPEDLEQQETAYIKRFWSTSTFKVVKNKLYLYDSEGFGSIVLKRIPTHTINAADLADTTWQLETVNGQPITDNSSARLTIYNDGTVYCQAGVLLSHMHFSIEDNLIRPVAGGGVMRIASTDANGTTANAALGSFGCGPVELKGQILRVLSVDGTTATFRKFKSAYTFDPNPPVLNPASGSSSWAVMYEDLAEVVAASDLIVMGTGIGYLGKEKQPGSGPVTQYDWKTVFRVDAVFGGTGPDEIILNQPVDQLPDGSFHYFFDCDPPVRQGERWIFFLRRNDDGTYTESGPWGRYKIIDEKVYSMNRVTGDDNAYYIKNLDINGEDTWTFLRSLQHTLMAGSLTFWDQKPKLLSHVFGLHAAGLSDVLDVKLTTGWSTFGNITFNVRRVDFNDNSVELSMPAGVDIRMDPPSLSVEPDREYSLTLHADTSMELPPAIYQFMVEARSGDTVIASRGVIVSIHQP